MIRLRHVEHQTGAGETPTEGKTGHDRKEDGEHGDQGGKPNGALESAGDIACTLLLDQRVEPVQRHPV